MIDVINDKDFLRANIPNKLVDIERESLFALTWYHGSKIISTVLYSALSPTMVKSKAGK